ncbi:MAG: hypothetical protein AAF004_12960 [Pseudomonadota bacterium]
MQLEHRIRLKALAFGIVLVAVEITIAGLLSWWQTQPWAGDDTVVQLVSAVIDVSAPRLLRLRGEFAGLIAELL